MGIQFEEHLAGLVGPGHSTSSHYLLGWCAKCPGYSHVQECDAWRRWAIRNVPEVMDLIGPGVRLPASTPATSLVRPGA